MTPAARVQSAIDLLDEIIVAARDGGPAADVIARQFFKARRYAGSKDRRAVRDLAWNAIRRWGDRPASGRAAMIGMAAAQPELAAMFDGAGHGPAPIEPGEATASGRTIPGWLLKRFAAPVRRELDALLERAPLDLRVNRLKAARDEALEALAGLGAEAVESAPDALRLPEGSDVLSTAAYREGRVEIQDLGSQLICQASGARPGMTVLDLCAGAGGKTLALAALMENRGRLIAADTDRRRLGQLPERAERAGASIAETLLLDPGKEADALAAMAGTCDVVLVDAPCSGTGTWRRNPETRWRLTPKRLEAVTALQVRLLKVAATMVAPGGRMVYAVCSLLDEEGAMQADRFLEDHTGWKAPGQAGPGRVHGKGTLLDPSHDGCDGFYFACFSPT
ncbi:RsmB/NOP family class I SAM-dependent RNA methyltransferase [Novosphingopyxis sp.]|uniref:RsmB/NOP family class I SAM-dependent RNA methyltransferase n=1 Tax=Novosphingopyxis sp. TaxID=2709690 RepID=UPI003B5A2DC6